MKLKNLKYSQGGNSVGAIIYDLDGKEEAIFVWGQDMQQIIK